MKQTRIALALALGFTCLAGLAVGQDPPDPPTLEVTKVVEWNGVEPIVGKTFEVCIAQEPPPLVTVCEDLADGQSHYFSVDAGADYVITEPGLGNEWDFLVGLSGNDPNSPDEVFVTHEVSIPDVPDARVQVTVKNSRRLEYAFVAIGNQILRVDLANLIGTDEPVLPDPEDSGAPYDTIVLYEAANTVFNGVTMAGDGKLYFCGIDGIDGFVKRLLDPLEPLPTEEPELVFADDAGVFDPHCGTVDPFGALVVANGVGGVLKFYQEPFDPYLPPGYGEAEGGGLAGMCVFRNTDAQAGLCWPDLPVTGFPATLADLTIDDSDDATVGFPSDVAYFYDNDLLVRTEVAVDRGNGPPGQQKKKPATDGALLRVFWPDFDPEFDDSGYDGGFCDEVDGCDPADCTEQNFKPVVSGLELEGNVTVSGNDIFVTDGKNLLRVVPPASPTLDCSTAVATTETYASVSGNKRIQVAAGDLGGKVYFGTRSSNSAGLYLADGASTTQLKEFPKNTFAAAIDGLAITLTPHEKALPAAALDRWETELDAMRFYLTADCGEGATVTEVPALSLVAQSLIDDIPDIDPNDPDPNAAVAIPNPPPGLDGWQALVETKGCEVTASEGLILTEFWYSILGSNRRITRHDSVCAVHVPWQMDDECFSSFESLLFNSLFDPGIGLIDPIGGGGRKRSRRQVVGAALDPGRAATFFGYLSPLFSSLDPSGDVYTVTPTTTVPIKFKLENNGEPVIGAVAMLTIARVANVPYGDTYPGDPDDPDCPIPEIMVVEPNGAGFLGGELGLTPLYEGSQGSGNYSFNQRLECSGPDPDATNDDWCNGDYRITTTFNTDNLAEQETLLRVTGCP